MITRSQPRRNDGFSSDQKFKTLPCMCLECGAFFTKEDIAH